MEKNGVSMKKHIIDRDQASMQEKLDHEQHYDIDGVTLMNGEIVIPSNFKIETHFFMHQELKYKINDSEKIVKSENKLQSS